ncbi:acyltransferase [Caldalkalibacillus mannanilyticus]|uniref:acyltransferase n=1 Tax=Caldalkalibacillus mannanilyticus TaxID=1418 RepID=UPI00046852DD|nr:acyltransferase [Caldalkalibacillus mannanilyticus]
MSIQVDGQKVNRGRDKFTRFKYIINLLEAIFKILPKPFLSPIWSFSNILPNYAGLGMRYCILRARVKSCGSNVFVGPNVTIKGWEKIDIGDNVSIHMNCYIDASGGLFIGNEVSIAHQSSIMTFDHSWHDKMLSIRDNPVNYSAVKIQDDVWIGCGCRILSGVEISSRSIVAAGAVVTKNVCSNTIVGGVPAKKIKDI